jgi:type II secretory pathway pseudopilin PulG
MRRLWRHVEGVEIKASSRFIGLQPEAQARVLCAAPKALACAAGSDLFGVPVGLSYEPRLGETRPQARGITLVEVLVVIFVIGLLIALLMPAVQAAREAGRRSQCANHLRQLSVALQSHHAAHQHFPSGGWTYRWLPDPDAGYGREQPGSWVYGLLPYLEQTELRDLGKGASGVEQSRQIARLVSTPLAVLNCPSRRPSTVHTVTAQSQNLYVNAIQGSGIPWDVAARSDYGGCASGGEPPASPGAFDRGRPIDGPGPNTKQEAIEWETVNPATGRSRWKAEVSGAANGAIIARYPISLRQVSDGASKTYLLGEKFIEVDHYETGYSISDDQSAYVGFDRDNQVSARFRPLGDTSSAQMAQAINAAGEDYGFHFGSAHAGVFYAAMCDGSVQLIANDIDLTVHRAAGSRDEAESVPAE